MVLIAGCAAESVTLVNEKGERWSCSKSMGGGLTSSARARDFDNCVNAAAMQGFKRVGE
jgi:hypothetical protein